MPVAVDVPLEDLPVVRAGLPRGAGVGEDDPLLEIARIDIERDPPDAVGPELDRGDAAVQRRTIVLHARGHANRPALDVHGDLEQVIGLHRIARPPRQHATRRNSEGGRSGNASAGRRFAPGRQRRAREPIVARELREERELAAAVELGPGCRRHASIRVDRSQLDAPIVSRLQLRMRAEIDRGVNRLRAVMKQVEWPDVDRAAGEIDPRRRGGDKAHDANYSQSSVISRQSSVKVVSLSRRSSVAVISHQSRSSVVRLQTDDFDCRLRTPTEA